MISWGTIKTLLLFFGPLLLPKAIAYYRSARAAPAIQGRPIRPVPPAVSRALSILFAVSLAFLLSTFPYFSPENIFSLTQSRLQIPVDVLFTRLSALRPHGLTEADSVLRLKLPSLESRLLYFQYGPDVLMNCLFCNTEDPKSYLYYALPALLKPHLFNLCVIALVTSGLFVGPEGALWRTAATIGAGALAGAELWLVSTYEHQLNARATRLEDIDMFFWNMRIYRGVAIAALDALLGWILYLSSTNRAFVTPVPVAERIESATRLLEAVRSKLSATGVVRNTVIRDAALRGRNDAYWVHEGRLMGEMMEDREVVEGVQNALESRIDIGNISRDAEMYARSMLGGVEGVDGSP